MLNFTVLTVSSSRTLNNDLSGRLIIDHLLAATKGEGKVLDHRIVRDDQLLIQHAYLSQALIGPQLILVNGGTGIAQEDVTIPALLPLLEVRIPGFSEAFRQISYEEIGPRALASRAVCGFNHANQLTYCLPGSQNACQTALDRLIIPEYQHLLFERSDQRKEVHHHAH